MILASVWHTGTTYFKEGLIKHHGPMEFSHTQAEGIVERCRDADTVYVTYRDPFHTAASWGNRGRPWSRWDIQWENYWKIRELDPLVLDFTKGTNQHGIEFGSVPLNQHHDRFGLHEAVENGDWEHFYSHVPRLLVGLH